MPGSSPCTSPFQMLRIAAIHLTALGAFGLQKLGEDARMAAASMLAALCVDQRDVAQETRLGLERSVVDFVVENGAWRSLGRT